MRACMCPPSVKVRRACATKRQPLLPHFRSIEMGGGVRCPPIHVDASIRYYVRFRAGFSAVECPRWATITISRIRKNEIYKDEGARNHFVDGLRKAGLPE